MRHFFILCLFFFALIFLTHTTAFSQTTGQPTDCTIVPDNERVEAMNTVGADETITGGFFGASPTPFCRVYKADIKVVNAAVAKIIPRIGYPIKTMDANNGFFVTDSMERSSMLAHWMDSFNITVQQDKPNETVVRVLRNLQKLEKKRWRLQASKGNNEKYILTQISDALASGSIKPTADEPVKPDSQGGGVDSKLKKLDELRASKAITEDEYKALRKKTLEESFGK